GTLLLLRAPARQTLALGVLTTAAVVLLVDPRTPERWTIWSPYQKLSVVPASTNIGGERVPFGYNISSNSAGYMLIVNYTQAFMSQYPSAYPPQDIPYDHYNIPYRFAGSVDNVLIVGSGAGNDVAAGVRNGAGRITAVDIDPRIIDIGRELHPESPYSNE